MSDNQIALTHLRSGESGVIVQIGSGHGWINKLSTMGILPGKRITKLSSMLMRGPVTIEVDRVRIALGHNMASRIIIRPDMRDNK